MVVLGIRDRELVLLSRSGVRVIDFGIARPLDAGAEITQTGEVMGSLGWIAPEQLTGGRLTPAADVFAWAGDEPPPSPAQKSATHSITSKGLDSAWLKKTLARFRIGSAGLASFGAYSTPGARKSP